MLKGIIGWFIIANFTQFFFTFIPMKYPSLFGAYSGMPSDGYQVLKILRSK